MKIHVSILHFENSLNACYYSENQNHKLIFKKGIYKRIHPWKNVAIKLVRKIPWPSAYIGFKLWACIFYTLRNDKIKNCVMWLSLGSHRIYNCNECWNFDSFSCLDMLCSWKPAVSIFWFPLFWHLMWSQT